ncbi:MAG TPA: prepilin-type N-terminal cleavage/methylation domain-containing protein [Gemmatimonadaceae bacterium]|nr:prepilin-type N-terminal cleavage/methylation domain-containing protein [Gemmatimonadaceae bacterium]
MMTRTSTTRPPARSGFTLIEVVIALTILGIIGVAATKLLTAQSRFYDKQTNLRNARTIARSSMNLILSDLRMVQDSGGVDSATVDGRLMRVVVPYRFGLVCGTNGSVTTVSMLPNDSATNAMSVYAGFAFRDPTSGRYVTVTPANPTGSDQPVASVSPNTCTGSGGGQAQIRTLSVNGRSGAILDLKAPGPTGAAATAPVFLWQRITYSFKASGAFPGYLGLYRNVQGGTNEELLAPFDSTARFRYYVAGDDTSRTTVPSVDQIRGVDLVLNSLSPRATSDNAASHAPSKMVTSVFFKNVRAY